MLVIPSSTLTELMVSTIARVEYERACTVAKYSIPNVSMDVALMLSPVGPKPMMLPRNEGSAKGDRLPLKSGPTKTPRVKKATWGKFRCFANIWMCSDRTSAGFFPKDMASFCKAGKAACVSITESKAAPAALCPAVQGPPLPLCPNVRQHSRHLSHRFLSRFWWVANHSDQRPQKNFHPSHASGHQNSTCKPLCTGCGCHCHKSQWPYASSNQLGHKSALQPHRSLIGISSAKPALAAPFQGRPAHPQNLIICA